MNNPAAQYLANLIVQLPLIVTYIAALVFCAMRWSRYPRPAQFAFLGTTFLLLMTICQPLITMAIATQFRGNTAAQIGQMYSITGFISSVVRATGFGFLIFAAFIHRAQTDTRTAFPFGNATDAGR